MDSSYYSPNEPISMCTVLIWKLMKYVWPSWTPSRLRRFFLLLLLNRFYPVFFSFGYKQRPPSKFKGPCESPWPWFRLWKGLFFNGRQRNRISLKKKKKSMASLHSTHQVPIRKTALGMTLEIDVLWKRPTKKKTKEKREREREKKIGQRWRRLTTLLVGPSATGRWSCAAVTTWR